MKTKSVVRTLTLSKYNWGTHHYDDTGKGEVSFGESFSPVHEMCKLLFDKGVRLGSRVKITMEAEVCEHCGRPASSGAADE